MKGQVRGQGNVRQTTNNFFGGLEDSALYVHPGMAKHHCCIGIKKRFLSPAFPMILS